MPALPVRAGVDSWTISGSGKWEGPSNWSSNAPAIGDFVYITNSGTKTVTIDSYTTGSATNTLTVEDLTLSSPSNSSVNTLFMTNSGTNVPLFIISNFTVLPGGVFAMTNAALTVNNAIKPFTLSNGCSVTFDGVVNITNSLVITAGALTTALGVNLFTNTATLNMTNSTFTPYEFIVGEFAAASATIVNSVVQCGGSLTVGHDASDGDPNNASLTMSGGQITATNTIFSPDDLGATFGSRGTGTGTFTNTLVNFGDTVVGAIGGASGTLILENCTATIRKLYMAQGAEPSNFTAINSTYYQQGGSATLSEMHVGMFTNSTSQVTLAGGTLTSPNISVGETAGALGLFTVTSGAAYVNKLLNVGSNDADASFTVLGGAVYVTNYVHSATTIVNGGSITLGDGIFMTDNLLVTNNGEFETISNLGLGTNFGVTNTLSLASGSTLAVNNANLGLGNDGTTNNGAGTGLANLTNATVNAGALNLGSTAGGVGVMTLDSNAVVNVQSNITILTGSANTNATSSLTVNSGYLTASNGAARIGAVGAGQMTINGGNVTLQQLLLGSPAHVGTGVLYMYGGQLTVTGVGTNVDQGLVSNHIIWGGGDLDGSGTSLSIGDNANSTVSMSAGFTGSLAAVYCGTTAGFTGTWSQSGGSVSVSSAFNVGNCSVGGAVGVVTLSGNATLTVGTMNVHNGVVIIQPGATLTVGTLVVTDACAQVINNGGTLNVATVQVSPTLDADGNGESNGDKEKAGLDLFNPSSVFEVTGVNLVPGTGMNVTFTTEQGHSYVVQRSTTLNGGFQDISPTIAVGGTLTGIPGAGTYTYTDTTYAAKNVALPATLFYQVRLGTNP